MLPDYPSIKKELSDILLKIFGKSMEGELGPFQGGGRKMQHEGRRGSYSTVESVVKESAYQQMEVNYQILYSKVPDMDFADVIRLVKTKGKEMGEGMGKYFFKTVNDAITETGNVVDAKGKPFTLDLMFEALEQMEIPFDSEGNPRMPTLVIHPNNVPRVRKLIAKEKKEKKYERRHKDLIKQKRKEWDEKQDRRKLVD